MAATTVIPGDTTVDAIHFEEYSKDNLVDFDSRLMALSEAPRPLLDPRTRQKLEGPGRPQGLTDPEMKAIEQTKGTSTDSKLRDQKKERIRVRALPVHE
jgi:hypothetical protein